MRTAFCRFTALNEVIHRLVTTQSVATYNSQIGLFEPCTVVTF